MEFGPPARFLLALGYFALGCGGGGDGESGPSDPPPGSLLDDPTSPLPARLSEVGLYRDLRQLTASVRALEYRPGYPLWSDGGEKQRFLVLPDAAASEANGEASVDAGNAEAYEFPVGTLLFKTFAFRTPASPQRAVPVETRLLRRVEVGWELAAYGWDEDARDAELLELLRSEKRTVLSDDGDEVEHSIPSRLECRQCHESSTSEVLGINELQLAKSGDLEKLVSHLEPPPSEPYAELPKHGELTTRVLGYLVGNCVSCHNGSNGAASSFDLRPGVALDNLIDQPTASSATAQGIRVVPGEPEQSVLFAAVAGTGDREVKDMPPVGVALRDESAIQLLKEWIMALGEETDP